MPEREVTTLFAGSGEMRELCRAMDWARTPLGPVSTWSVSLRSTVKNVLASRHPMFLFWGPDFVQIFNDAYRASLGDDGRHRVALGAKGAEFWTEVWGAIGPMLAQVMSGGESTWQADQNLPIFRDGALQDVYWTYSHSAAHDDDGKIAGVLVVCQETTSQVKMRSELQVERSRLEYVFQQAPSFVAVVRGAEMRFEFVNEAYRALVGKTEDFTGQRVFDVVPEAREVFEPLIQQVIDTGEPYIGREIPVRLRRTVEGEMQLRYIDFVYFPFVEVDGSRSGVIAHGVDITEQVEARREVERVLGESERARQEADAARREADDANKAKGEFLAMLSHELRTPLAAIGGYSELLTMGVHGMLGAEQTQYVNRIQHSQQHVLGLIDGLLTFAQVEAGKTRYHIEAVSIGEILAACELLTAPQMQLRGLTLSSDECATDLRVMADTEKTRQIIVNLLSNAIKFTPPGGKISVSCTRDEDCVVVRIRDTGVGIEQENLARIFEPFVRIDPARSQEKTGTGLGLAISLNFARGMGGTLVAESELGKGSTFVLRLPRAK